MRCTGVYGMLLQQENGQRAIHALDVPEHRTLGVDNSDRPIGHVR